MQVYIYICWHFELSGNANLHLYQCWFAFTHRSPIKNFASCRLREKNFASLRLRKNLVELRARLSLLVDKTTFQYSALTIYYTTIGGHAPHPPTSTAAVVKGATLAALDHPQRPQPWRKGRHGRAGSPPPAPHDAGEGDALDMPDHHHQRRTLWRKGRPGRDGITTRGRSRGRMGRARISTPPPPPWRKGKGGRCSGSSPAPARRGGRDATDAPGSPPPAPQPWRKWTPWTCRTIHQHPPPWRNECP